MVSVGSAVVLPIKRVMSLMPCLARSSMTSGMLALSISITAPSSSAKRIGRAAGVAEVATSRSRMMFIPFLPAIAISARVARRPPSLRSW